MPSRAKFKLLHILRLGRKEVLIVIGHTRTIEVVPDTLANTGQMKPVILFGHDTSEEILFNLGLPNDKVLHNTGLSLLQV